MAADNDISAETARPSLENVQREWLSLKSEFDEKFARKDPPPPQDTSISQKLKDSFNQASFPLQSALRRVSGSLERAAKIAEISTDTPSVLVTALPFVKRMRINRALEEISSIPEGKELVDAARKKGLKFDMSDHPSDLHKTHREFTGNKIEYSSTILDMNSIATHGQLVSMLVHELQHSRQADAGLLNINKIHTPLEGVWYEKAVEADAYATQVDISWKLKEAGKPAAWQEMKRNQDWLGSATGIYEGKLSSSSTKDGLAKRAVFDSFFSKDASGWGPQDIYNDQALGRYHSAIPDIAKMSDNGAPFEPLSVKDIQKLGTMSKVNYLDIPGGRPLDDKYYRSKDYSPFDAGHLEYLHDFYDAIFDSRKKGKSAQEAVDKLTAEMKRQREGQSSTPPAPKV